MGSVRRWLGFALAGVVTIGCLACRSTVVREGGVYRHRELGYAIGTPPGPKGYWEKSHVPRIDLGFRGREGEQLTLATRCGRAVAAPRLLARHLRFGLGEHTLHREGGVEVAGASGWMQVLEVHAASAPVTVKTVTVVFGECVFDFLLAARRRFGEAEAAFDAWLDTFRPGLAAERGGAS